MQLSKRAVRAGGWTFGGHVASQVLRFGSNLLMTRLLAPDTFGVMALALTFLFALNMASDLGLQQVATSSHRGDEPAFLDVIWTIELLRGVAICAAGLLAAASLPLAASMGWLAADSTYGHPDLPLVLALLAMSALITGTNSVKLITKARQLMVSRVVLIEIGSQALGIGCMILWAWHAPTVYALALGTIVSAIAKSMLSHLAIPGAASSLRWERATFLEIFRYGRWVFLSSILGFLVISLDKVILGAQLDATQFGIYSIAMLLFMAPYEVCQRIVSSVMFPALGEVARTRPEQLASSFYRMRLPVEAVAVGTGAFLAVFGADIVGLLYDPRYRAAGQTLQILSLSLLLVGLYASAQIYMVTDRPWVMSVLISARLVALAVALPLLTARHGLPGAAWAIVLSHAITLPLVYFYLVRFGVVSWRGELRWIGLLALAFAACLGLARAIGVWR